MSQRRKRSRVGLGRTICDDQTEDKYILLKRLGRASFANVFKAEYFPKEPSTSSSTVAFRTTFVALKMISMHLARECLTLHEEFGRSHRPQDHNNVIGIKKWFTSGGVFCFVMPYMDEGSLRYIVSERFKNGMPEDCIAIALREALLGLSFIHRTGGVHRYFSAANIFVNGSPTSIMLAFEASIYEHHPDKTHQSIDAEGASTSALDLQDITSWATAPEVYKSNYTEFGPEADIWLVGITALELAYGCLPVANREDLNAIIKKIIKKQTLPRLGKLMDAAKGIKVNKGKRVLQFLKKKLKASTVSKEKEERLFSKDFEKMVAKCLAKKPAKRPTADELLQSKFFTNCKNIKCFQQIVINAKKQISDD